LKLQQLRRTDRLSSAPDDEPGSCSKTESAAGLTSSDSPSKVDDEPQSVVVEPRFPKSWPVSAAEGRRRAHSHAAGMERGLDETLARWRGRLAALEGAQGANVV